MPEPKVKRERYKVAGEKLLSRIRELVHEGNVRRIILKNDDDKTIIEIPLTLGVVGALLLPVWVAIGAIAALAADYTLEVEKVEDRHLGEAKAEIPDGEAEPEPVEAGSGLKGGDPQC